MHTLTGGIPPLYSTTYSLNSTQIVIEMGSLDLNQIKLLTNVSTEPNNTYISITAATISDMNSNAVVPVEFDDALQASHVIEDTTPPEIASFSLNMNTGILILTFVETVNASSLNISSIMLLSNSSMPEETYMLVDSTVTPENGASLEVVLGHMDELNIGPGLLLQHLIRTYLRLDDYGVADMNDLPSQMEQPSYK